METIPPNEFQCPITLEVMTDPVVCSDGHTYERKAILKWIEQSSRANRQGRATSPKTAVLLDNHNLLPNYSIKSQIIAWKEQLKNNSTTVAASTAAIESVTEQLQQLLNSIIKQNLYEMMAVSLLISSMCLSLHCNIYNILFFLLISTYITVEIITYEHSEAILKLSLTILAMNQYNSIILIVLVILAVVTYYYSFYFKVYCIGLLLTGLLKVTIMKDNSYPLYFILNVIRITGFCYYCINYKEFRESWRLILFLGVFAVLYFIRKQDKVNSKLLQLLNSLLMITWSCIVCFGTEVFEYGLFKLLNILQSVASIYIQEYSTKYEKTIANLELWIAVLYIVVISFYSQLFLSTKLSMLIECILLLYDYSWYNAKSSTSITQLPIALGLVSLAMLSLQAIIQQRPDLFIRIVLIMISKASLVQKSKAGNVLSTA